MRHLGLQLDRPVVVGLRPLAPITHWRGGERLLGANIAPIAGVRVQSMAELRTVLTELRQLGRQGMVAINAELTRPDRSDLHATADAG